jgi:hypothetical protein
VIADGGSLQLRFFDSQGVFSNAVGGPGEGPGEFRRIDSFRRLRGDTLAVLSQFRIVSLFTGRGEFVRRVTVAPIPSGPRPEIQIVGEILTPEAFLVASLAPSREARGERWVDSARLELLSRDTVRQALGRFPAMLMVKDNPSPRPPWFGPNWVFAGNASAFFVAYGAQYSIQVYSSDGRLERIIRRRWTPVRVTRQDIESYVTEWAKRWIRTTGAEAEAQRRDLRDDPYADELPAFSQFIVDRTGRLWVREAHVADAPVAGSLSSYPLVPSVWSVFDRSGLWLGDVTMPARFLPFDVGPDYVLGVARDEDDVQTVVEYRLGSGAQVR